MRAKPTPSSADHSRSQQFSFSRFQFRNLMDDLLLGKSPRYWKLPICVGWEVSKWSRGFAFRLWNLREVRDVNWQGILNHCQGMLKQFFQEKKVELLQPDQCRALVDSSSITSILQAER